MTFTLGSEVVKVKVTSQKPQKKFAMSCFAMKFKGEKIKHWKVVRGQNSSPNTDASHAACCILGKEPRDCNSWFCQCACKQSKMCLGYYEFLRGK